MATQRAPQVVVVRYEVIRPDGLKPPSTPLGKEFNAAVRANEWPYDPADDPAFFCAQRLAPEGGVLSWGICRPDVRNRVRHGDVVVFFGHQEEGDHSSYRFSGFATVKEKIGQDQIWEDDRYAVYRQYLNLLIQPAGDGLYRHHETHPGDVHDDWLTRLVGRNGYSWEAGDFEPWKDRSCEKTIRPGVDRTPSRQPIRFARNYVLFDRSSQNTVVPADPPLVAIREPGMGIAEQWLDDALSRAIKRLTLDRAVNQARGLRSSPTGYQHAPMPLKAEPDEWRSAMHEVLARLGLAVIASVRS